MAVTTLPVARTYTRSHSWIARFVLGACASALSAAVAVVLLWLIISGAPSLQQVLSPLNAQIFWLPLLATLYVVVLAVPPTIVVGVIAAIAVADIRIFGESAPGIRRALGALGNIPTVVLTFGLLAAVLALGWHPSLTGAAFAVAAVNLPLMTAVALSIFSGALERMNEAAVAAGASSSYVVRFVLLPLTRERLLRAIIIIVTQMVGGVVVIAMFNGALAPHALHAPLPAWPLAVQMWLHAADAKSYGTTAAIALVLILFIWLLQGIAALRSAPAAGAPQEDR